MHRSFDVFLQQPVAEWWRCLQFQQTEKTGIQVERFEVHMGCCTIPPQSGTDESLVMKWAAINVCSDHIFADTGVKVVIAQCLKRSRVTSWGAVKRRWSALLWPLRYLISELAVFNKPSTRSLVTSALLSCSSTSTCLHVRALLVCCLSLVTQLWLCFYHWFAL